MTAPCPKGTIVSVYQFLTQFAKKLVDAFGFDCLKRNTVYTRCAVVFLG